MPALAQRFRIGRGTVLEGEIPGVLFPPLIDYAGRSAKVKCRTLYGRRWTPSRDIGFMIPWSGTTSRNLEPSVSSSPIPSIQTYFSHSYRDVPVNTYFSELFVTAGISLRADQKTDVWCMAKLERYLFEMDGFVSIIPRRIAPDGSITFSPYIAQELTLARRARAPRVLFVDSQVLSEHRSRFPEYAVPFFHEAPDTERARHTDVIEKFRVKLATGGGRPHRKYSERQATVVAGREPRMRDAASHVEAILRSENYNPLVKYAAGRDEAFDDIDGFESLLNSELCVFLLTKELSYSDVFLAMAHAHCVPSVRLRHDPEAKSSDPELSGTVQWKSPDELASQFLKVFRNYQSAFPKPSGKEDLEKLATQSAQGKEWDTSDGPALLAYIDPEMSYINDVVDGVLLEVRTGERSRVQSDNVCRGLYDLVKRRGYYYSFEPFSLSTVGQKVRSPLEIDTANSATCLDLVCLFAALLEAARQRPVVLIIRANRGDHAVAGYWAPDAVTWNSQPTLDDLRGALVRRELVLFETTGAVEKRGEPVAAETKAERRKGRDMLDYSTAKDAAERLFRREPVEIRHFLDVKKLRRR